MKEETNLLEKRSIKRIFFIHPVRDLQTKKWKVAVQYNTGISGFLYFSDKKKAIAFVNQFNNKGV